MAKDNLKELANMYGVLATKHQELANEACADGDTRRVYHNMKEVYKYMTIAHKIDQRLSNF